MKTNFLVNLTLGSGIFFVLDKFSLNASFKVRFFLKSCASEIWVNQIRAKQGFGVPVF
jgi:hypothetical protein